MRKVFALLLTVVLAACAGNGASPPPVSPPQSSLTDSVVLVVRLNDRGEVTGWGTGWAAGPDVIVTAAHVVTGAAALMIETRSGRRTPVTRVLRQVTADDHDVASLEATGHGASVTHMDCSYDVPPREAEEPVTTIGHPSDRRWVVRNTTVYANVFVYGGGTAMGLNMYGVGGISGSPVYARDGRVIGMIVATIIGRPFTFAIPAARLCADLR